MWITAVDFTVAEKYQIDWLRNEPQSHGLFENWVQLSQRYVDNLRMFSMRSAKQETVTASASR